MVKLNKYRVSLNLMTLDHLFFQISYPNSYMLQIATSNRNRKVDVLYIFSRGEM